MTSQTTGRSALEALASPNACPTVIRVDDTDAVVLGATGQEVQLWIRDSVASYAVDTGAELVTDPVRTESVLRQAITSLNTLRRQAQETTASLEQHQAMRLTAIRDYAIEAHRDGDICRDGLDQFLETFDLDEYDPYVGLTYRMTGSFTVTGTDEGTVRSTVTNALAPDLDAIRGVRAGSARHMATIQAVRPAQLGDGGTAFEFDFVITGQYEVDKSDTDDAEADSWYNLHPNAADIPAVMVNSASFTIESMDSDLRY